MKNPLSAKGHEGARRTPFLVRDGPPGARVRGHPQGVPLRGGAMGRLARGPDWVRVRGHPRGVPLRGGAMGL
ncbi:MAG: hypothetical protein F4X56_10665 [Gammaproteobacteria bacterium]|nr:hypothetical protein [Gammaproteobacteria bacterium]